jgi:AraC-like DNA-binding protein
MLTALSDGKIVEVVEQFDDRFTFTDHALAIEFTDKERFTEFLRKMRCSPKAYMSQMHLPC